MRKRRVHLKSLLSLLVSKVVIVSVLIAIQIIFLVIVVFWLAEYFTLVYSLLLLLSMCAVFWLLSKEDNPSYKLAWVILLLSLPIFGGLFYLVFGNKKMPKLLSRKIEQAERSTHRTACADLMCVEELKQESPHLHSISHFISNTTGAPLWQNTQSEYLATGEVMWQRMLTELQAAKRFIFMEYFIIGEGEMWSSILDILKEKAAQGLDVRLLFDDMGSIMTVPSEFAVQLREHGIRCLAFNPFKPHLNSMMNYRDHRKITVIDGEVGFCGGINIADEYVNLYERCGHWKDTGVLLRGSGVWNLTAMFLSLWNFTEQTDDDYDVFKPTGFYESDGYVQPFGDSPLDRVNVSEETYMQIINRATRYVYITTPYLILDNEMVTALRMAARSGVDVRIITPHIPDKWIVHEVTRSSYGILLDAGVRIYEYTPGFIHAKMYVSDDEVAVVGTANMDYRSFYLHFECGVCFYKSRIVQDVREDFMQLLEVSQEIPADYVSSIPLWRRALRAFFRLFSPMM